MDPWIVIKWLVVVFVAELVLFVGGLMVDIIRSEWPRR